MAQVGLVALGVGFKHSGSIPLRIRGNAQQHIVAAFVFIQRALDSGELGGQKRAEVGTGGKNKSHQDQFAAGFGKLKGLAVLIHESEIGHNGLHRFPADLAFLGRDRQVGQRRSGAEAKENQQPG